MKDIFLILVSLSFLFLGVVAPFTLALGYVWVDFIRPQELGWSFVRGLSLSLYMGAAAVGLYLLTDRKDPPQPNAGLVLLAIWAIWVTLTTTWAIVPNPAWAKWDWAFKVICFAFLIPFFFRTRVQIEALLLTIIFSIGGITLAFGTKTAISGGGYGRDLGLVTGNAGLGEGSALALTATALVPLILFFAHHSQILPKLRVSNLMMYGFAAVSILTCLGTHARTGLVALIVLAVFLWWQSKHKLLTAVLIVGVGLGSTFFTDERWSERMDTILNFESEGSAATRIAVWKWTWNFAKDHPLGGGFGSFRVNSFEVVDPENIGEVILEDESRAFHSNYFEVLGEHGYPGLVIYGLILVVTFTNLWRVKRQARKTTDGDWLEGLAKALTTSAIVYLVGAAFIGVAFQPFFYYIVAASICMTELQRREAREREAALSQ